MVEDKANFSKNTMVSNSLWSSSSFHKNGLKEQLQGIYKYEIYTYSHIVIPGQAIHYHVA